MVFVLEVISLCFLLLRFNEMSLNLLILRWIFSDLEIKFKSLQHILIDSSSPFERISESHHVQQYHSGEDKRNRNGGERSATTVARAYTLMEVLQNGMLYIWSKHECAWGCVDSRRRNADSLSVSRKEWKGSEKKCVKNLNSLANHWQHGLNIKSPC